MMLKLKYDPKDIEKMEGELGRILRCVNMAMGCLDNSSKNKDEALAYYRLMDALYGFEPCKNFLDVNKRY